MTDVAVRQIPEIVWQLSSKYGVPAEDLTDLNVQVHKLSIFILIIIL